MVSIIRLRLSCKSLLSGEVVVYVTEIEIVKYTGEKLIFLQIQGGPYVAYESQNFLHMVYVVGRIMSARTK